MEKFQYRLFKENDQRKYIEELIRKTEETHYHYVIHNRNTEGLEHKLSTYYKIRDELGPEMF